MRHGKGSEDDNSVNAVRPRTPEVPGAQSCALILCHPWAKDRQCAKSLHPSIPAGCLPALEFTRIGRLFLELLNVLSYITQHDE
jgi:hypothetical protein